jgi:hypothetical protein
MTADSSSDVLGAKAVLKPAKPRRDHMPKRDQITMWVVIAVTLLFIAAAAVVGFEFLHSNWITDGTQSTSTSAPATP